MMVVRSFVERFRENYPEGREAFCWYSGYEQPFWQFSVWVSLDKWGLGIETEVDLGRPEHVVQQWPRRRFFALQLGPVALILMRESSA